jgi:hypothetical protein
MATEFPSTRRGAKFYDFDIPKLTDQLERIANALESKNKIEEKRLVLEQKKLINEKANAGITRSSENSDESTSENA